MAKWIANLSDGSTLVEKEGLLEEKPGGKSSWTIVEDILEVESLNITAMRISCNSRLYFLPSINGQHGGILPSAYRGVHKKIQDVVGETSTIEQYIGIKALYNDYAVTLWVNEATGDSCVEVNDLNEKDYEIIKRFGYHK